MSETKAPQGRKTKYKKEYDEQARKLCLLGLTDKEIGDFFGVDERTINNWKKNYQSFFQSIQSGKQFADSDVAEKLYRRATGYTHKETKVFCQEGQIIEHEIDKHYPPDTGAAFIWLKNRQPKKWRDRQPEEVEKQEVIQKVQIEVVGNDSKDNSN